MNNSNVDKSTADGKGEAISRPAHDPREGFISHEEFDSSWENDTSDQLVSRVDPPDVIITPYLGDDNHGHTTSADDIHSHTNSADDIHGDTNHDDTDCVEGSACWGGGVHYSRRGFDSADKSKRRPCSKTVTLRRRTAALAVAACMLLSCLFGLGGAYIGNNLWGTSKVESSSTSTPTSTTKTSGYNLNSATGSNLTVQEITAKTQPSVVEIKTESVSNDVWMQQYVTKGAGSGVIISEDGYIITNNHLIESASKIDVTTSDGKSYEASLIGKDSTNDVAVLKIDAKNLSPATYGNSDELQVGDLAVAIGNPLGELGGTVTAGIISAKDRQLNIDGKTLNLLQTDSSINPGNSGGGLFNGDGQLVGIVVAKSSGSDIEGLAFAIPVNTAAEVAQQLIDKGYVAGQPWTGMSYTEGNSGYDSLFGNSSGTVYIYSVETSTAKKAGFKPGDVVFAVDGTQISSFDELSKIITSHKVGDVLKFTIVREGKTQDLNIKLQEKTKEYLDD